MLLPVMASMERGWQAKGMNDKWVCVTRSHSLRLRDRDRVALMLRDRVRLRELPLVVLLLRIAGAV